MLITVSQIETFRIFSRNLSIKFERSDRTQVKQNQNLKKYSILIFLKTHSVLKHPIHMFIKKIWWILHQQANNPSDMQIDKKTHNNAFFPFGKICSNLFVHTYTMRRTRQPEKQKNLFWYYRSVFFFCFPFLFFLACSQITRCMKIHVHIRMPHNFQVSIDHPYRRIYVYLSIYSLFLSYSIFISCMCTYKK